MEERLLKAVKFFRTFPELSDKELYRKYVLRFCTLVEEFVTGKEPVVAEKTRDEQVQEVFKDITKESGGASS